MENKVSLISGINGQDGSYLAELLLKKGHTVHGIVRRGSTINTRRIDHLLYPKEKITLHYGDLGDANSIVRLLLKVRPDEVYNIGSMSHVRVSFDIPTYTGDITGLGGCRILEAMKNLREYKLLDKDVKYYQASSSEMYGLSPPLQDENTLFLPVSPYGCFPSGTKILCKGNKFDRNKIVTKNIEDIKKNDIVFSYNETTGRKEFDKVMNIMSRKAKKLYEIKLTNGNMIKCTGEHPIYVTSKTWVEAKDLKKGDKVIQYKYCGLGFRIKNLKFRGKKRSKKWCKNISDSLKGKHAFVYKNGEKFFTKGKTLEEKYGKEKGEQIRQNLCGRISYWKGKKHPAMSEAMKGSIPWNKGLTKETDERIAKYSEKISKIACSKRPEVRKKISNTLKKLWKDENYRTMILRKQNKKPNNGEIMIEKLLDKNFQNQFKYVGNRALWIGYPPQNPDFVHKTKNKVIEYNGTVWHNKQDSIIRENNYKKSGYDCLTIWDTEPKEMILERIETFLFNPNVDLVKVCEIKETDFNGNVYNFETENNHNYFVYGILVHNCAKLYMYHMTRTYRFGHNMFACNGILFNHGGPRRGETFVTKKIVRAACRIKLGKQDKLVLGNLSAMRDWGFAGDYIDAIYKIMHHSEPDDFVVATSEIYSVQQFLELVFKKLNLSIDDCVETSNAFYRPNEVPALQGDSTKIHDVLGWKPKVNFEQLVDMMIKSATKEEKDGNITTA